MIGELVGGYRLTQKLGEGATGETYLGVHKDSAHQAAVKILFPQMCADAALIDQFFADIKVASLVNHSGIADLLDCGVLASEGPSTGPSDPPRASSAGQSPPALTRPSQRAFVIGEYLQGKTLTDALIELGQVTDVASLADIAWQVATMLGAAHEAGIVHGALKPDALFLTFPAGQSPRPLVKLVDFGMAKFKLGVRQSQTGSLLGAPLYMSPEMSRGVGTVDRRADIYSLGCIMFEMICGRPPFVRAGAGELIIAHAKEPPPFASSLEPSVPQAIDQLIGRMLTKNPLTRPQTMGEVAAVLERFFKCPTPSEQRQSLTPVSPQPAPGPSAPATPPAVTPMPAGPPERPSSVSGLSATALVPAAPATAVVAAPQARKTADATAILQPDPRVSSTAILPDDGAVSGPLAVPAPQQSWLGKVRQHTVIQASAQDAAEPFSSGRPTGSMREQPSRRSTGRRSTGQPVASTPSGARAGNPIQSINLSVVVISAAVLLVVAAIVLLVTRGPAVSTEPTKRPAARSEFVAPTPAEPSPAAYPVPSPRDRAVPGSSGATPPEDNPPTTSDDTSTEVDDDSPGARNHQGKDKGRPRRFW